jgi:hypothetical protein
MLARPSCVGTSLKPEVFFLKPVGLEAMRW